MKTRVGTGVRLRIAGCVSADAPWRESNGDDNNWGVDVIAGLRQCRAGIQRRE